MAFATFAAATAHYHPERAPSLLIYFGIIMRLAREGGAKTWLCYDRTFRQAAAINPSLPWDCQEPDLWLAALSQEPQRPTNPPRSFGLSDVTGQQEGTTSHHLPLLQQAGVQPSLLPFCTQMSGLSEPQPPCTGLSHPPDQERQTTQPGQRGLPGRPMSPAWHSQLLLTSQL